jgi:ABC-type sugar transport system ATPase subunit
MSAVDHLPPDGGRAVGAPTIVARDITKSFGAIHALKGVSADFHAGEVHALVGENGAGKSTFLGVLAGRISATSGTLTAFGHTLGDGNPRAAHAAGISAIYQELTMIPARPAFHNVFLGQFPSRGGLVDFAAMQRRFSELCAEFGVSLNPHVRTDSLSIADQQLIEIMRALHSGSKAILFDEPTASLGEAERSRLLESMAQLRSAGATIAFVSHHLDEVLQISDRITVFRDGQVVSTAPVREWTKEALVRDMMGRDMSKKLHRRPEKPVVQPVELLRLDRVAVPGLLRETSLSIRAGEVLGIAGLVGSGRTALVRTIAGLERAVGTFVVDGKSLAAPRSVRAARAMGVALIPEDRKGQGLVLGRSSATNVVLADFRPVTKAGMTTQGSILEAARKALSNYAFNSERLSVPAGSLSGGNQQKLLLGRWTHSQPKILLADEPTRGIDVGAKAEILTALRAMALEKNMAVVIVSSELEEVLSVADRIVVMHDGAIVDERDCHAERVEPESLLQAAFAMRDRSALP